MSTSEGEPPLSPQAAAKLEAFQAELRGSDLVIGVALSEEEHRYNQAFETVRARLAFFRDTYSTPDKRYGDAWHSVHEIPGESRRTVWIYGVGHQTRVAINDEDNDAVTGKSVLRYTEYVFSNNLNFYNKQEAATTKPLYGDWNPTSVMLQAAALIQVSGGEAYMYRGRANRAAGLFEPNNPLTVSSDEQLAEVEVMRKRQETTAALKDAIGLLKHLMRGNYYVEGVTGSFY